jgi:hypothetical protein
MNGRPTENNNNNNPILEAFSPKHNS